MELLTEIIRQQAPPVRSAGIVGWFMFKYIKEQHKQIIEAKDAEIARLVAEKTELQKINQRLSTKTDHGKGKEPLAEKEKPQKKKDEKS